MCRLGHAAKYVCDRYPLRLPRVFRQASPPRKPGMVALEAHVEELCDQYGIEIAGASRRGRATRWTGGRRQISIPEIRGQVSYFVALHEIGHLVGPGRSAPRLEAEANAWLWALRNSAVEPTPATRRSISQAPARLPANGRRTASTGACRRGYRSAITPSGG